MAALEMAKPGIAALGLAALGLAVRGMATLGVADPAWRQNERGGKKSVAAKGLLISANYRTAVRDRPPHAAAYDAGTKCDPARATHGQAMRGQTIGGQTMGGQTMGDPAPGYTARDRMISRDGLGYRGPMLRAVLAERQDDRMDRKPCLPAPQPPVASGPFRPSRDFQGLRSGRCGETSCAHGVCVRCRRMADCDEIPARRCGPRVWPKGVAQGCGPRVRTGAIQRGCMVPPVW